MNDGVGLTVCEAVTAEMTLPDTVLKNMRSRNTQVSV